MTNTTYWSQKPNNVIRYETVTFQHPDIEPVRLVANQYEAALLGGQSYTPVAMRVKLPQQDKKQQPRQEVCYRAASPQGAC